MQPGTRAAGPGRPAAGLRAGPVLEVLRDAVRGGGRRPGRRRARHRRGRHRQDQRRPRACATALDHGVRVLAGACDDLLSPRALGPAARRGAGRHGGPAGRRARGATTPDAVPGAAVAELAAWRPTVLVVEDLHWADDATLDVARPRRPPARRPARAAGADLPRRGGPPAHPLRRVLGALTAAPVHRLALRAAVARRGGRAGRRQRPRPRGAARADRRQPVLRHRGARRARGRGARPPSPTRCWPGSAGSTRRAARPSSSCPSCRPAVELGLAQQLLGAAVRRADPGRGAGRPAGPRRTASRSATSSRAAPSSRACPRCTGARCTPASSRRSPRRSRGTCPGSSTTPSRAGDVAAVLAYAPAAGREAAAAGSHRQALALLEAALRHAERLPAGERAPPARRPRLGAAQRPPPRRGRRRVASGRCALLTADRRAGSRSARHWCGSRATAT